MPTMPDVTGLTISQATANLIIAGIVPDNGLLPTGNLVNMGYFDNWPIKTTYLSGNAPGIVISSVPAAGATIAAAGSINPFQAPTITLTVGSLPMGVSDRYSAGGYS